MSFSKLSIRVPNFQYNISIFVYTYTFSFGLYTASIWNLFRLIQMFRAPRGFVKTSSADNESLINLMIVPLADRVGFSQLTWIGSIRLIVVTVWTVLRFYTIKLSPVSLSIENLL